MTKSKRNTMITTLGLVGLFTTTGCNIIANATAKEPTTTPLPVAEFSQQATSTPTTPSPTPTATFTPYPTPTVLPTSTPWTSPMAWSPASQALPTLIPTSQPLPPTLTPVPVVPQSVTGVTPFNYSPPDGVDVFGNVVLRWDYPVNLAEDEFFDIKIKPLGDTNSAFVDWAKTNEYELRPWNGWQPGLYTWQIGIVKGYKEGETKHFISDTGRDSQPYIIKWQPAGYGGGGGSSSGGGGGGSSSGGGGSSGGS